MVVLWLLERTNLLNELYMASFSGHMVVAVRDTLEYIQNCPIIAGGLMA